MKSESKKVLERIKGRLSELEEGYKQEIVKLNEDIEKLTEPGMAEKIVKKSFSSYPVESIVGTAVLGYLTKKGGEQLHQTKKVEKLETELAQLAIKYGKEAVNNKKLKKGRKLLSEELKDYRDKYETAKDKKDELRIVLVQIKKSYENEAKEIAIKLPDLGLVKYEAATESESSMVEFERVWKDNNNLIVKKMVELQQFHTCSPCLQFHASGHVFPTCNLEHCSHSEKLKEHVCPKVCSEAYHERIRNEREREVVKRINTECKLGCNSESNLGQIISKIKELISAPGGECLTMIVKLEKEVMKEVLSTRLFDTYNQQLGKINDYQELVKHRQEIFKAQLAENSQVVEVNPSSSGINTKTILAGSLLAVLLAAGGMLMWKKGKKKVLLENKSQKSGSSSTNLVKPSALPTIQEITRYLTKNGIKSLEINEQGKLVMVLKE